jgi:hypothetical protein
MVAHVHEARVGSTTSASARKVVGIGSPGSVNLLINKSPIKKVSMIGFVLTLHTLLAILTYPLGVLLLLASDLLRASGGDRGWKLPA